MFNADDLIWIDFEVFGGALDLKAAGPFRYVAAASTHAIVLAYAIGNAPARTWHADSAILDWDHAPDELRNAFEHGATLAAWNASFDAAVWNYATLGFPFLTPERVIDPMVQAGVSNLPTDLESALRYLGGEGKQKDGKALIKLFCIEGADPRDHPEEWKRFLAYAHRDIEAMREAYRRTRPLPLEEWQQYWVFEHINRRGVMLDMPYVRRAAALAAEDGVAIGRRLAELTNKAVTRVTQAKKLATWLHDNLADAAMREILMVGVPLEDDVGEDDSEADPPELSLQRDRVARVLAMLEAKHANGGLSPNEARAREAATLRLYGAGAAPRKFHALETQQVDGVLRGQYRFAGAGQTGRMSSRGAQIHNLTRDVLGENGVAEGPLVKAIAAGCDYATLVAAEPTDMPATRKLALIVRPAIVAGPRKLFVWSDWSAIEARLTPWIANSEGAERVLDVFRANDRDSSLPDCYVIAAADIFHKHTSEVTKPERQVGKVVVLACGFAGGVDALKSMALSYHIHLEDGEAKRIVDAWRAANPWALEFWGAHGYSESYGLWGAAMSAIETPGLITRVGRVAFMFHPDYLGGALFMELPSGRLLTYPRPRWREVEVLDKDGNPTGEKRTEMSIRRAHGRTRFWRGVLAENSVSATANDILRATVMRIETNPALGFMSIRMTTHDEIVCEVDTARADEAKAILRREMLTLPPWAEGLPLQSEEQACARYSKSKTTLQGGAA